MPVDDALLADIHHLIEEVGRGNAETLLELLRRIVAAEAVALQLRSDREQDRAERGASESQLRAALQELRLLVWGILAILGVIVLILVIATIASISRGG